MLPFIQLLMPCFFAGKACIFLDVGTGNFDKQFMNCSQLEDKSIVDSCIQFEDFPALACDTTDKS